MQKHSVIQYLAFNVLYFAFKAIKCFLKQYLLLLELLEG